MNDLRTIFYKNKWYFLLLGLAIVIYFLLRVPNLTLQPIFADEAIYIRWSQVMKAEPTLRFVSLSDGKTPLYMWILMPVFKVLHDPLFAGRFLSVISGLFTLFGVLVIGWMVFDVEVAVLGVILYAITPYTVFFDRMALVDSMLSAFTIWSLVFLLWLRKKPQLDLAMILGFLLGGAMLVKTPAMINFLVLPASLIGFDFEKKFSPKLFKFLFLLAVSALIGWGIYNTLRLGPGFSQLSSRNSDYAFSLKEILQHPLDPFLPHTHDVLDWFMRMISPPLMIFMLFGIVLILVKRKGLAVVVLVWSILPMIILMTGLRTFTARYLLFSIPPLLLMSAYGITTAVKNIRLKPAIAWLLVGIIILPLLLRFDYLLLTDPAKLDLPANERSGYFEVWTAGYGFKDIAEFLISHAQKQSIVVGTQGSFGTLPDGLQIYLEKYTNNPPKDRLISVIGGSASISAELRKAAVLHPTFFVANGAIFNEANVIKLKEYPKVSSSDGSQQSIILYQINPH